ncbi:MAG TPA: sensor domain-containing diguanylate cyclase [Gaiellaceae bacterium]|jgi:diguanylate cyclase (GGDEF)-like protein
MRHTTSDRVDLIDSYRRLTAIYHDLLSHDNLEQLLERIADSIVQLVPCDSLLIAEVDPTSDVLVPILARGRWSDTVMDLRPRLGEGLIGWAAANARPVLANDANVDPRAGHVEGTPESEPEAIISVPLVARGAVLGAISMYREAEGNVFSEEEFELAQQFGDAATLALVNFKTRSNLEQQACTDDLTQLLNRRGFFSAAQVALAQAGTSSSALLLVDLDDFKSVNDACGHDVGDAVLKHVARQLCSAVRGADIVARLGGDEFALVLPRTPPEDVRAVADRIHRTLEHSPYIGPHGRLLIPASVGFAVATVSEDTDLDVLLREADDQMYQAKRARSDSPRARRLQA